MAYKGRLWYIWKDLTDPMDGSVAIQDYPAEIINRIKKFINKLKPAKKEPEMMDIDGPDISFEVETIEPHVPEPQPISKEEMDKLIEGKKYLEKTTGKKISMQQYILYVQSTPFDQRIDNPYSTSRQRLSSYTDNEARIQRLHNTKQSYVLTYKED